MIDLKKKNNPVIVRQVDIESLFNALYTKGEAKLSDHSKPITNESK